MVAVTGTLDVVASAALTERVAAELAARPERLVMDMSGVGFLDSAGVRALAAVISPAPGKCPVVVRSLRPAVRRQLELMGVDLASPEPGLGPADLQSRGWDGALAGSPTLALVRQAQDLRTCSEQAIAASRRAAQSIASTEDKIAAALLRLADRRPKASARLTDLSQTASSHAARMRDQARHVEVRGTAGPIPPAGNRHYALTGTLGRAVAFIEERAHDDIGVDDIAAAAFVTVRAVQLAFRRHLGTTPVGYLRQVRLERAHRQLLAAGQDGATVTMVAAQWGFSSPSRFTAYYRAAYGVAPSQTLRHGLTGARAG